MKIDEKMMDFSEAFAIWICDLLGCSRLSLLQVLLAIDTVASLEHDLVRRHFGWLAIDALIAYLWWGLITDGSRRQFDGVIDRVIRLLCLGLCVLNGAFFFALRSVDDFVQLVAAVSFTWLVYLYTSGREDPPRRRRRLSLSKLKELFGSQWLPEPTKGAAYAQR